MTASAQGEDRSSFQPVTSWAGLSFGFVKATEGTGVTDVTFAENWANLGKAKLPRGAYHFFHPGEDPRVQAQHFVKVVQAAGLTDGDMLVVDSELLSGVSSDADTIRRAAPATLEDMSLTPAELDSRTKEFLDEVKTLVGDRNPLIVYTMHEVGQHLHETAAAYPLVWFAYPSSTAPSAELIAPFKSWLFWQWGQAGSVDRDAFNGTAADLAAFIKRYLPVIYRVIHWRCLGGWSLAKEAAEHKMTPEGMIRLAALQGHKYGPAMQRYIKARNWDARLPRFTVLYAREPV